MLKPFIPAATAVCFLFAAPSVEAMPRVGLDSATPSHLTMVFDGCGPYGHRGPYGHCRPGGQLGGYIPGASCPPGFHIGPGGRHCWRN